MAKNKEMLLKWADALEYGKYQQHRGGWGGFRHSHGALCCLNVAIVVATGTDLDGQISSSVEGTQIVAEQFGIFSDDPREPHWVDMNDFDRLTFPQIAAKVRKYANA